MRLAAPRATISASARRISACAKIAASAAAAASLRHCSVEVVLLDSNEQSGSCQCGRIRYAAPAEPLALYVCHCTECRKQSASAFGVSFTVARAALRLLQGTPHYWSRVTASGHTLECAFCPDCGSRLWHRSSGHPDTLNIKGGSLDRPLDLAGAVHLWVSSKLPGVVIPSGAVVFAQEPDNEP